MSLMEEDTCSLSDSSNEEDDDIESQLVKKSSELESELSANKYLYDVHIEVINVYRKLSDLNSLREAYQRFHKYFPLTPQLWLDWIRDEIRIAHTPEERRTVLSLFEEAVEDYLCVDLWIEYAQFSLTLGDLETTRSIIEKGLTYGGLHASKGGLLWDTLREVENAHASLHPKDSVEWANQLKRVAEVFKRQLSVPLLNMENTYEEWREWSQTLPDNLIDPEQIEWGYKKALQLLETYKPFEDRLDELSSADAVELQNVYKEYIKAVKDPSTVICLYERAVVSLCLTPSIWEDYIKVAFKMEEVALRVSKKALRNCPWSEDLWIIRLQILENYKADEAEIVSCFEEGLTSINPSPPLEFWCSFLEYYCRNCRDQPKVDKLFSKALEHVQTVDPSWKLSRWYARLLASRGDLAEARKIWSDILSDPNMKASPNAWLEFTNIERQYGEIHKARSVFKRALSACKDWAHFIGEEWMLFERQIGSLEDVMKCSEQLKKIPRGSQVATESDTGHRSGNFKRKHETTNGEFNSNGTPTFKKPRVEKEKAPVVVNKPIEKDPKCTVFVSNLHPKVTEPQLKQLFPNALLVSLVVDKKGKSRCFGYIHFSKEEEALTALARDRTPIDGRPVFISELKSDKLETKKEFKYSTNTEENKLFVKGLPVTKTKEDVEEIFKKFNPVEVRLIFKKNGQSKGIAYVEFETKEEARRALEALNSTRIDDCELFVAISDPPKPSQKKPDETLEPIRHSRSRLQVPLMVPRTVQIKNISEKPTQNDDSPAKVKKSNADFRNMLLNS
ncbi:unnamed protein product [Phyllotreta striolata]|uniref:RRM domain-containing protein n=1 Tax=Phyllotreta striolata TaxID=444603 RepID=A0A9N9TPA6_PHYSR|nr:unnamed protein product [Phyllotreta striolata]